MPGSWHGKTTPCGSGCPGSARPACASTRAWNFGTVLQGVLDSARALTGARYGVITLLDDGGRIQDFLYSGLTAEESLQFAEFPDGMLFFERLSGISEPLRLRDFHGYVRALGLPEFQPPMAVSSPLPFLAAPLRHRGEGVGGIYVGREGDRVHRRGRGDSGDVRLPGGAGHRQRPPPPGGAAGPGRPGDPGEHHSRGRPGPRRQDGEPGVDQPGGEADRQRPVRAGRDGGAAAGGADLLAGRRAGGLPAGVAPGPDPGHRGDGAG